MYKVYADDTELLIDNSRYPDLLVFGGIIISREEDIKLRNLIRELKSEYTHRNLPIKYNIKDLKEVYERFNRSSDYEKLLKLQHKWKSDLFNRSQQIDYKVVISCYRYKPNDKNKKDQKALRSKKFKHLFANFMMRVALFIQNEWDTSCQLTIDMPGQEGVKIFNDEYYSAFNKGKDLWGNPYCNNLESIGFEESVLFSSMNHNNSLQFADIVVGACKDFIDTVNSNREESWGKTLTLEIINKYLGYPNNILQRGIIFSNRNYILQTKIKRYLDSDDYFYDVYGF